VEQIFCQADGKILVLRGSSIQISEDEGKSWQARSGFDVESDVSCLVAPLGLDTTHPLWVGLANGQVIKIKED
jgi:hypothetical protein